jgi:hypothetical protein
MKIIFTLLLSAPFALFSQINISAPTAGSQSFDFNTLASSGTLNAWTDNTTIPGFYAQRTSATTTYDASTGTGTTGTLYSYGLALNTERALGTVGSNSAGNFAHGMQFKNSTLGTIENITVGYTLEEWRCGNNLTPQAITFWYKVSSSAITALTPNNNTGWTAVTALTSNSPVNTATAGALDGNQAANRVVLAAFQIQGLALAPGQYVMFKWEDINHAGNDHGLAIDDVSVNWTYNCRTSSTQTLTACGSFTVPSGQETYTTSGTYTDTIPNVSACDSVMTFNLTVLPTTTYYADADGDTYGNAAISQVACALPIGYVTNNFDCNDANAQITVAQTYYADADNDTYGNPNDSIVTCIAPAGYVSNNTDCNDANASLNALQTFYADVDNDTYGDPAVSVVSCGAPAGYVSNNTDCNDADAALNALQTFYADADNDTYGDPAVSVVSCGAPAGYVSNSSDCNDSDVNLNALQVFYADADNDTYGSATDSIVSCGMPAGYVTNNTDCNDANAALNALQTFYADVDNDTYGDASNSILSCGMPAGYVTNNTDCNDADASLNALQTFYADVDNDTYGDASNSILSCGIPAGYVTNNTDCNDANPNANALQTFFADTDNDSYGDAGNSITACSAPAGYVSNDTDCDDTEATVFPGAPELCDGLDNNCNLFTDEGLTFTDYYTDADNDTYGTGIAQPFCTNPGAGYALNALDCDDNNPNVNPGATDIAGNSIDENCDQVDGYAAVNTLDLSQCSVQPNPSAGLFQVSVPEGITSWELTCYDLNGKILLTEAHSHQNASVDLRSLQLGVYLLEIKSNGNKVQKRIVLQ